MTINKSFEFKNTGEITTPQEHIHAQDLYGMIGFSRGFGIISGCAITLATNQISVATGSLYIAGNIVAFAGGNVTVDDTGMSSGEHRWTNVYITPAGAIGKTDGTNVDIADYPIKPTDLTNMIMCSALKLHGSNLIEARVRSSVIDLESSSVTYLSDVSNAGSGIIITTLERNALHSIYSPPAFATPSTVGSTNTEGSNSTLSRSDHIHEREHAIFSPGVVTAHSDVSVAGSGIIISANERNQVNRLYPTIKVATEGATINLPFGSNESPIQVIDYIPRNDTNAGIHYTFHLPPHYDGSSVKFVFIYILELTTGTNDYYINVNATQADGSEQLIGSNNSSGWNVKFDQPITLTASGSVYRIRTEEYTIGALTANDYVGVFLEAFDTGNNSWLGIKGMWLEW